MNNQQGIILYACGSDLIVDYIEVCLKNAIAVKGIIHNQPRRNSMLDSVAAAEYNFSAEGAPFLVPLFTPHNRYAAVQEALCHRLTPFPLLNDRNNDLPFEFTHGHGCFINKRVVIGSNSRLGDFVVVNRGACLGHHFITEDFVSVGPGVVACGHVTLQRGALIGAGAVLLPETTIGEHAIVNAGSVVTKNVPPHSTVAGNPAKVIRRNEIGF